MKRPRLILCVVASASLLAACAGSRASRRTETAPAASGPAAPSPTEAARAYDGEPDVRDLVARPISDLKTVHFAYDSSRLDEGSETTLKANAEFLKAHEAMKVQVAGNCDQRGTVAYNLALGQRRAEAVRDYYKSLGVEAGRIATISYGKEKTLCAEAAEGCWSRNRRAETLELISPAVAGAPALR